MLSQCQRDQLARILEPTGLSLFLVAGRNRDKLNIFLKGNSLLSPSSFLCHRSLGACDALLQCLTTARLLWAGAWREGLFSWIS